MPTKEPGAELFWDSFKDAFLNTRLFFCLVICAFLSLISGMIYNPQYGWIEGTSIIFTIFVLILVTTFVDW